MRLQSTALETGISAKVGENNIITFNGAKGMNKILLMSHVESCETCSKCIQMYERMIRKFGFELEVFCFLFWIIFSGFGFGLWPACLVNLQLWQIAFWVFDKNTKNVKNQLLDRSLLFIIIYCLSTFSICSVQRY